MNFKENYISKSGGNSMDHIFDKNIFSVRDTVEKMKDNISLKIRQKLHSKHYQIDKENTEILMNLFKFFWKKCEILMFFDQFDDV